MDSGPIAPETEHYLEIMDASNRVTYVLKMVGDEKRKRHLPGEVAFLGKIETELKGIEQSLVKMLNNMGRPNRCPQCGREGLQEGLDALECPGCKWKHDY